MRGMTTLAVSVDMKDKSLYTALHGERIDEAISCVCNAALAAVAITSLGLARGAPGTTGFQRALATGYGGRFHRAWSMALL